MISLTKLSSFSLFFFLLFTLSLFGQNHSPDERRHVVLLHGLARSNSSMEKMAEALQDSGFIIHNLSYPSREHSIAELVAEFVWPDIQEFASNVSDSIDFVTHSMGGILVRELAALHPDFKIGRVVMLSPPNKGSELVDKFGDLWLFDVINGPAGKELGTSDSSTVIKLGPAPFEVGIITGDQSLNLIWSSMIEGEDDGKVSVERAKLEGMKDFLVISATHPFIMRNETAIEQTLHFLNYGQFEHNQLEPSD